LRKRDFHKFGAKTKKKPEGDRAVLSQNAEERENKSQPKRRETPKRNPGKLHHKKVVRKTCAGGMMEVPSQERRSFKKKRKAKSVSESLTTVGVNQRNNDPD